jgi:hypothetical protein
MNINSTSIKIKQDIEGLTRTMSSSNESVRYLALDLCARLKMRPGYTTDSDDRLINAIVGEDLISRFNASIVRSQMDVVSTLPSYQLTLQKCNSLKQLISQNSFVLELPNDMCKTSDGVVLIIHDITMEKVDARIQSFAGAKFSAIQAMLSKSRLTLFAISNAALNSLYNVTLDLRPIPVSHNYIITTPLIPKTFPTAKKETCCVIL